jgi:two-component system response regulator (stage 0 sporulation protein A)
MNITKRQIIEYLAPLGIPANHKGYKAIIEALSLILYDESYLNAITKRLYPDVAKIIGGTWSQVERAIRHSIEYVYGNARPTVLSELLVTPNFNSGKLRNSEFMAYVSERIRLENGDFDKVCNMHAVLRNKKLRRPARIRLASRRAEHDN